MLILSSNTTIYVQSLPPPLISTFSADAAAFVNLLLNDVLTTHMAKYTANDSMSL